MDPALRFRNLARSLCWAWVCWLRDGRPCADALAGRSKSPRLEDCGKGSGRYSACPWLRDGNHRSLSRNAGTSIAFAIPTPTKSDPMTYTAARLPNPSEVPEASSTGTRTQARSRSSARGRSNRRNARSAARTTTGRVRGTSHRIPPPAACRFRHRKDVRPTVKMNGVVSSGKAKAGVSSRIPSDHQWPPPG